MVSIIITYIDEHEFLTEAVKSAMSQDFEPIEVIVVCNMPALPEGYNPLPDYPVIKFIHEPKLGSAHARNAGLQQAIGELASLKVRFLGKLPAEIIHTGGESSDGRPFDFHAG